MPAVSVSPARLHTRVFKKFLFWIVPLALLILLFATPPALDYQRSILILQHAEQVEPPRWIARTIDYQIEESSFTIQGPQGQVPCRLYMPRGVVHPSGLVLLHGVHRLGISEPRLVNFARAFAASGVAVLTPELTELADYRIEPASIATIAVAVRDLSRRLRQPKVGVMGLSFAGGLALIAAAEPQLAPSIAYVVSVGAHDDLTRVAQFLVTGETVLPNGTRIKQQPEQYGALVLVYAHVDAFFAAPDVANAHEAIRLWLWEQYDAARAQEKDMTGPGRDKLEALFHYDLSGMKNEILADITRNQTAMRAVSPHGRLQALHVPVYLLHGAEDAVIPSSETLWLEQEVPASCVRSALISNAVGHVDVEKKVSWRDQWLLIKFMAGILRQARHTETPLS
jgi:dienelactone hydrolase